MPVSLSDKVRRWLPSTHSGLNTERFDLAVLALSGPFVLGRSAYQ